MISLHSKQFIIRDLFLTDLEHIHRLHSMPGSDQVHTVGIPNNVQTTEKILNAWIENQNSFPRNSYILRIENRVDHQFVGLMSLNIGNAKLRIAETWFRLHAAIEWREHACEAMLKLLSFGFHQLNLHRIESDCSVHNIDSIKVLEMLGFSREGKKRQFLPSNGHWVDSYMYAILDEDFEMRLTRS